MVHEESEHAIPQRSSGRRGCRPGRVIALHSRKVFDLTLFDQSRIWVEQNGTSHLIDDLDAASRRDLAVWLRRNARHFYAQVLDNAFAESRIAFTGQVPEMMFLSAEEWMAGTALLKTLETPDD